MDEDVFIHAVVNFLNGGSEKSVKELLQAVTSFKDEQTNKTEITRAVQETISFYFQDRPTQTQDGTRVTISKKELLEVLADDERYIRFLQAFCAQLLLVANFPDDQEKQNIDLLIKANNNYS